MANNIIEFKLGKCSTIFMQLNSANLNSIKREFKKLQKKSPHFLHQLQVILPLNPYSSKLDLHQLQTLLAEFGVRLAGVSDWQTPLQKELIHSADLPLFGTSQLTQDILPEVQYRRAQIVNGNVLAGSAIYAKNSDLIIHGDVEKGAEVASTGNIHIYGKLLGRASAGVNSQQGAIYTQYLDAEFIAVSHRFLARSDIPAQYLYKGVCIQSQKERLFFSEFFTAEK